MTQRTPNSAPAAMLITPDTTYLPGRVLRSTPESVLRQGLPALLSALAKRGQECTVILCGRTAAMLGLPVRPDLLPGTGPGDDDHPVHVDVRAAGWDVSRLRAWTTYYRKAGDRPDLHVGILPLLSRDDTPILCDDPADTVDALATWHARIGVGYRSKPGPSAIALVRETAVSRPKGRDPVVPLWRPREHGPAGAALSEYDYEEPTKAVRESKPWLAWAGRPAEGHTWMHGYDLHRAYLAAAAGVMLASYGLRPTGKVPYERGRAGWWLVELSEWPREWRRRLPDPAGYSPVDGPRWVTGPTLALLDELAAEGIYGGYDVLDSWTAANTQENRHAVRTVLRGWAERLRDAWLSPDTQPRPLPQWDAHLIAAQRAFQAAYKEGVGMLGASTSRAHRPDWRAAIVAEARTRVWRRARKVGDQTGRWPLFVHVDNIWYSATTPDAEEAAADLAWTRSDGKPDGIVLGDTLGTFSHKGTRQIGGTA